MYSILHMEAKDIKAAQNTLAVTFQYHNEYNS